MSAVEAKQHAFLLEPFLEQAHMAFSGALQNDPSPWLQRHAVIVFKPDAIVGRRVETGLAFLEAHGFDVHASKVLHLSRLAIETIWRFQWNIATLDRHALAEEIYCGSPSLLVVLRDRTLPTRFPATVRLRQLKGPAQVEHQRDGDLRWHLRTPNRTMSLIHTPDEPIDVLRESAICFPAPELREFAETCRTGQSPEVIHRHIEELYTGTLEHSLDLDQALERVREQSGHSGLCRVREALRLWERDLATSANPYTSWTRSAALIQEIAPGLGVWDTLTLGASTIQHDIPDLVCTIDDDGVRQWKAGLGKIHRILPP